ncbi:hypothetical protein PEDI_11030 [Persicobacter diffluens]|uniref:Uncharacterized protein n=1 Tax=Persicobacter diffluens TaxID=981 RepID=A0AAN5AKL5_9BACT|nr:hypothetical protein PEDI_11030 [Persicobacter diffluens]
MVNNGVPVEVGYTYIYDPGNLRDSHLGRIIHR